MTQVDKLSTLTKLKSLTLHGNPIEINSGYRFYVISRIPQLQTFDFSGITKADRASCETWRTMIAPKPKPRKRKVLDWLISCWLYEISFNTEQSWMVHYIVLLIMLFFMIAILVFKLKHCLHLAVCLNRVCSPSSCFSDGILSIVSFHGHQIARQHCACASHALSTVNSNSLDKIKIVW